MTVAELIALFPQLGIVIVVLAISGWAFLYRRRDEKGDKRPPLLVGGWVVEEMEERHTDELAAQRKFFESTIRDRDKQTEARVGEIRGYRDEAIGTNAELLRSLSSATKDIALVLQILDLASRDGNKPGPTND